ncbi:MULTISPECIES: 4-amino-4-deoxy-L-arabinose-phosphoundecaprenol flippase subunit ArnE [Serratia]|jgi:undecaprenyl phosphate-alpha-L-ara4N flippase subunit ArnE|uniref:4-amino-4-deoxy-L-arabinose-phosphoundecaprenol flippase subunit ArnE n=1 Tax=Serratia grimesii TaxID=82995 RepID=UPI00076F3E1A|nr:4-amino-4-deoxy-L-arabinose-phosphoundecaprenol flippase subunit ArnE [Serratia grimesii]CAI0700533.1 Undecaprenyl phosphate-aminoarabinose flippase subunit ArnE [Serratia grimesii]CAI0871133.1 Undecaprenyl phosphate-aminoarabinose flippase subunit ArnE [Serratia grimesii]CAI1116208.1 Undecaprenyl phosphate-aminoarabinose flippase subunit ArnE [Serratia grimesii]CAI2437515.1 Undecaprenyl phosphate-aminoarabinose flippase subunit ArnE [Serratia grimesii]CAI2784628.1 Undecaprenyl phosphate-am
MIIGYLLVIVVSLLTCGGQLCQKQAAQCWQLAPAVRRGPTLRWLALAVLLLGLGMAVWLNVLQRLPLSLAYPTLSLNFVLVTLAARWLFKEPTTVRHWCGVGSIMLGILLMSINP